MDTTHAKYFTYPKTTVIPGTVKGNTISWTVPLVDVGSPVSGNGLFSVTGFTATQLTPSAGSPSEPDANIPNLMDASPPFSFTVHS